MTKLGNAAAQARTNVKGRIQDWLEARETLSPGGTHSLASVETLNIDGGATKPSTGPVTADGVQSRNSPRSRPPITDYPPDVQKTDRWLKRVRDINSAYYDALLAVGQHGTFDEAAAALGKHREYFRVQWEGGFAMMWGLMIQDSVSRPALHARN